MKAHAKIQTTAAIETHRCGSLPGELDRQSKAVPAERSEFVCVQEVSVCVCVYVCVCVCVCVCV